jgi:glucose-6-phosphate 1-epimerase
VNDLEQLTRRFGIPGALSFDQLPGSLAVIRVESALATASVMLQGAQVIGYQPRGERPLIWLSSRSRYVAGKSVRGGVPVCWPWFGPHATDPALPAHGFARTVEWDLQEAMVLPDGRVRLKLELAQNGATRAQWPYASSVRNTITIGRELEVSLATHNIGSESFRLGQALHTYFQVGDVRRIAIHGLDGCAYLDKVGGSARRQQQGPITFTQETDRIYLDTGGACEIRDSSMDRCLLITATGSRSTVVWNPWIEKAEKMGDFEPDGYLRMVCVETANAADDTVNVAPGQEHVLAAQYRLLGK